MGGSGPNVVTGTLRRSIVMEGPVRTGLGTATARVGPTVVYGRIQELGGTITAKNAPYLMISFPDGGFAQVTQVTLPPRPFLEPAVRDVVDSGALMEVMTHVWGAAIEG
jgi:phage gpG-like protein